MLIIEAEIEIIDAEPCKIASDTVICHREGTIYGSEPDVIAADAVKTTAERLIIEGETPEMPPEE